MAQAQALVDDGAFEDVMARWVAIPSTLQEADKRDALTRYLSEAIVPAIEALGCHWEIHENPDPAGGPFLIAERWEAADRPTVLLYGHGDTVQGQDNRWRDGLEPWQTVREGDRLYGRGTADNKGQHAINLLALLTVLEARGSLGFNLRILIEMSEEVGSRGLREFAEAQKEALTADVLIASDGPRLKPDRPTIFLGSRGVATFKLSITAREGAHHSGNWGGLISNPAIQLLHAVGSIVDRRGAIQVEGLKPPPLSNAVRAAIADCEVDGGPDAPQIDPDWGEPGLTPWERVFGWNTFEVIAFEAGNPANPVNAVPASASAVCQIRFIAGSDQAGFEQAIRDHLQAQGFGMVTVESLRMAMAATRTSLDDPWVERAVASLGQTLGQRPAVLPNLGGSIPNDVFTDLLGMPTVWVPHSYAGCSQHAPNEHLLLAVAREGLGMMAGLYWDIGEADPLPAA
ncbi:MAG: M20 family metallopeptidase [Alphaproteobacteria bacterium]|nr:M20 family metallopeptidase [Alphaproteobacteria bacterium]MCB9931487.1 M20 family metallopeptidase [Alphaproteobacteria bacterium]